MEDARPKSGAATRQAIMDAAMALFLRQGFHGTTMRQIALGSGVSLGAAYNHFAAKYDIFRCLVTERNPYLQVARSLVQTPGSTAAAQLEAAMRQITIALDQNADFIRLALIDILEFQGATLGQAAAIGVPAIGSYFKQLIEKGIASGEFRPAAPSIVTRAVMGMSLSSVILQTLARPVGDLLPAGDWVTGYLDLLLHGLNNDHSQPSAGDNPIIAPARSKDT